MYNQEHLGADNWPTTKFKRFIIETEWDTGYWAFLPLISWNIHFCEIELRWLCAAIMFRDNKTFMDKSFKIKTPKPKKEWNYWKQWL